MRTIYLIFIVFFICSCSEPGKDSGKTVFRYNESAGVTTLDPSQAKDQALTWVTNQLFNGLVQLDDQLKIHPCIARSWDISKNGCELVFHLRKDVFFHPSAAFKNGSGRAVLAGDFVYSFNRLLDPVAASPGAWVFSAVDKSRAFDAIDDSTLLIRLAKPFPPFLGLLTMQYCSVVPHEAIDYYGVDFRSNPVGTGPFRFKMWQEGVKLVMVKNENYFETHNGRRLPYLDAVAVTFIPDRQTAFLDFMKGKLDFISGIDAAYKDELLTHDGKLQAKYKSRIRLITQPYLNTEYLGFMVEKEKNSSSPAILDKRVRQAINYSFDREKMIRYLRNNIGTPGVNGITPKGLPSFDSTAVFYNYNPAKAAELLAEAGFAKGRGLPPVVLTSTADYLDICKYIQYQVAALGIELKIDINTPAAMKGMKADGKLPFFRASWIADYPDAENYLSMFVSDNFCPKGPNYTQFSNRDFDRLYVQSLSTASDSVRYSCYRRMERIMMDEAPVVILYYDQVLRFVHSNIEGLGSNPMNLLTLKGVRKF